MNEFFELEHERVIKEVLRGRHKLVAIQLPEAMKKYSFRIARIIEEETGARVIVLGDKCYGSCCLGVYEAEVIGATLLIHYGHIPYPGLNLPGKQKLEVLYIPCYIKLNIEDRVIEKLVSTLEKHGVRSVAIASTIQEYKELDNVREKLVKKGFKVLIGKAEGMPRGVILGCNYNCISSVARLVDAIVVLCGGEFHPLGTALKFNSKLVIQLDPYRGLVSEYNSRAKRVLSIRYKKIMDAIDSRRWVLWIGLYPGQYREYLASVIEKKAVEKGYECLRVYSRYVGVDELYNIDSSDVDVHVVTSCPRIPIDDLCSYQKPVLTPGEALMVLENRMNEYIFPW